MKHHILYIMHKNRSWAMQEDKNRNDIMALLHTGDEYGKYLNAVVPPVFLNSLHAFDSIEDYFAVDPLSDDAFVYGRDGNPTVHLLERKLAELEHGCRAVVYSSGMAAFTAALMATCKAGSHVICMRDIYMPIKRMFDTVLTPKFGMHVTFVSGNDLQEIEDAARPETALMILESPASYVMRVVDLAAIAKIARRKGFRTYMDNSALSPIFQNPLDFGIDLCMHTMSKYIGGHSDIIGGVLAGKDKDLMDSLLTPYREFLGGIMGPMEAWLTIRGLRTLEVRMRRFDRTGREVAAYLAQHPKVKKVYHTSLASHPQADLIAKQQSGHGSLMSFELKSDDPEKTVVFANSLKVITRGCSWGGHESLVLLPLLKEPQEVLDVIGMGRGLIRIYCGLEGSGILIEDLAQALEQV